MQRFLFLIFGFFLLTTAASADARSNMAGIVKSLEGVGFEWEPWGNDVCSRDDLCSILAGHIQVQAIARTVDVLPSSREPLDVYLLACSAVLAGLTGRDIESAMRSVSQVLVEASGGRAQQEFGAYRLVMKAPAANDVECSFYTP